MDASTGGYTHPSPHGQLGYDPVWLSEGMGQAVYSLSQDPVGQFSPSTPYAPQFSTPVDAASSTSAPDGIAMQPAPARILQDVVQLLASLQKSLAAIPLHAPMQTIQLPAAAQPALVQQSPNMQLHGFVGEQQSDSHVFYHHS